MKDRTTNPWRAIERIWRTAERIAVVFSILTIVTTVGYVSVHALT